jgi:hypothetical protein
MFLGSYGPFEWRASALSVGDSRQCGLDGTTCFASEARGQTVAEPSPQCPSASRTLPRGTGHPASLYRPVLSRRMSK